MIADIRTVMWKEGKSLLRMRGSRSRFWLTMLSPILLATVFPWQWGADWVEEIPSVILSFVIPIILVGLTIPDSFAGERERHTLGTLLASRLPDRAILLGKLAVSVALGWGMTIFILSLSVIVVNVAHWEGQILFYTPTILLADLSLSLLMCTLIASTGVIVSLRSETVQEASQRLMAIFLIPPMILQFAVMVFRDRLEQVIEAVNGQQLLLLVLAVLLVLDVTVGAIATARFRRSQLCLS
jgi:ABC-2 type transport system permease protein